MATTSSSDRSGLHIPASRIRTELFWLGACLAAGVLLNAYAIVLYSAPWSELLSQAHVAGLLGLAFYGVAGIVRLAARAVRRAGKKP